MLRYEHSMAARFCSLKLLEPACGELAPRLGFRLEVRLQHLRPVATLWFANVGNKRTTSNLLGHNPEKCVAVFG